MSIFLALWQSRCNWHLCSFRPSGAAPSTVHCSEYFTGIVRERNDAAEDASAHPPERAEVTVGLSPRVNLNQHLNLVPVDFIGWDGAEGSIPCLEDDDRDHERGGE
jgi:hypothetical protein